MCKRKQSNLAYQGGEQKKGEKKEHLGRCIKGPRNGFPSQAREAWSCYVKKEHRPEHGRKPIDAGEPLIKRHKQY